MFFDFIRLTRPLNIFIAFLSVLLAAYLSDFFVFDLQLIYAITAAVLIACAGNVINDIFDIEIDKINKPDRVLSSERISLKTALKFYYFLNITGLIFAYLAGFYLLLIAVSSIVLLFFYSFIFKRTVLMGNFLVSFISALAFIYGALAGGDIKAGFIPALFAFLFHFGREIIKDIEDVSGDTALGATTLPIKYGKKTALLFVNVIFLLLSGVLFIPVLTKMYNIYYIVIILTGVLPVLIFISIMIWIKNSEKWMGYYSILLKTDMFIGLLAILAGVKL